MSRLAQDPHPRPTRKPSSGFTSAAARLLLRHSGREAANGESIEFFSALRKCLPDPHVSSQTARGPAQLVDGRGKMRRGGSADEVLSLASEVGKHDYDWLLTPPGTPLWSPASSCSGDQISAPAPSRLAKAGSATSGRSIPRPPRLGPTGPLKESPTMSRLSNCSSATSANVVPSGRPLRVRTSSASLINTVSSTPLCSAGSSPRTPGTARSAAAIAQPYHRDSKARQATGYVAVPVQSKASKPGSPAPSCTRAHPAPGIISSPRSTVSTPWQPSLARRVDAVVARSRLASQSSGAGSKSQPRERDPHPTRSAHSVASSSNPINSRPVPAGVKQASRTTTQQRWRQSLAPAIAAARNVQRDSLLENGSPRNSAGRKATPHRHRTAATATAAALGLGGSASGLTRTGSRKHANTTDAKRTVNDHKDCGRQDAKHRGIAGAPAHHQKPALLQEPSRSVIPRSRLGLRAASPKISSIASSDHRQSSSGTGYHVTAATAMARVAGPDAFPSMRYDAMLLREDPKNLTWLRGCDEGDDARVGGLDLVDSSLEPFDMVTGRR